jgi:hypothetical protein
MIAILYRLNRSPRYVRWPVKSLIFLLTVFVVCFPCPGRFVEHVRRWSDPNALVEPNEAALRPWFEELQTRVDPAALAEQPSTALRVVERFVYEKVPYDWDWNTWGIADYLPTVAEVAQAGREDCDGRAVVAASLLRKLGVEAEIVTDFSHVWVKTPHGETMGPGKRRAVEGTDKGLRVNPNALLELPKALAFGVAVFPLARELVIVAVLWLLLIPATGPKWLKVVTLMLMLGGLAMLKVGGANFYRQQAAWQWLGVLAVAAGIVLPLLWGRCNRVNDA